MPDTDRLTVLARRWQESFERSATGQVVMGLDGQILAVNDGLCHLTGYNRDNLLGRPIIEVIHPDDRPLVMANIDAMLSGKLSSARLEKRCIRPDGGEVWNEETVTLIRDAQGAPDHFVAFVVDINERKRLELQLHERDALLTSLTRNIPGTLIKFVITPDGRMLLPYASDGIQELYEMDLQLLRNDPMRAFERIHAEDRPAALGLMQQHIEASASRSDSPIPDTYEYRLSLPRKGIRWMRALIRLEREPDGGTALYTYISDISEQKAYEQALLDARAAEAASHAKSDFLSRMSHELRTPLNAVIGFAQILQLDTGNPLRDAQKTKVELIERAGEHLLAMISDVLDLSRIESGSMTLSLEPLDVSSTMKEALAFASDAAHKAQVELVPPLLGKGLFVRADRLRLRQVLINLLTNAIKYNHVGGKVRSRLWLDGQRVMIDISDTGPGLTAEQQSHLFEPFNRLGAESSGVEGTGIGLVIVRHLVQLMGGNIGVSSQVGHGAHFVIDLPATDAIVALPAARHDPWMISSSPSTVGHVLYAEDNEINVMLVSEILRLRGGIELSVATTGAKAIECAREKHPDLLLLDMHLGDMTGFDVATALDRDPATARIPRVILSADAMPSTVAAAKARGFADYLTKPLDARAILNCLEEHLPKPTP